MVVADSELIADDLLSVGIFTAAGGNHYIVVVLRSASPWSQRRIHANAANDLPLQGGALRIERPIYFFKRFTGDGRERMESSRCSSLLASKAHASLTEYHVKLVRTAGALD